MIWVLMFPVFYLTTLVWLVATATGVYLIAVEWRDGHLTADAGRALASLRVAWRHAVSAAAAPDRAAGPTARRLPPVRPGHP